MSSSPYVPIPLNDDFFHKDIVTSPRKRTSPTKTSLPNVKAAPIAMSITTSNLENLRFAKLFGKGPAHSEEGLLF